MSTGSSPTEMTQGATPRIADVRFGDMVFFKVEETIFQVPRYRFTQYSEVFADMFLMPQAEGTSDLVDIEGRDEEHPILLRGYQAADFAALVKILYPSLEDTISKSYPLLKEEWVGVLNLSTKWQIKMLRDLAITKLSSLSLTPVEKVTLARAHKVAKWLKEGLNEILAQEQTALTPHELKTHLGIETAFQLMWIQIQSLKRPQVASNPSTVTLRSLGCLDGHAVFPDGVHCNNCSRRILLDDPVGSVTPSRGGHINLQTLRCKYCSARPVFLGTHHCPSCSSTVSYSSFKFLVPPPPPNTNADKTTVEEQFKEEIASYESWDQ